MASFRQQMADYARGEEFRRLREERHLSQEDAAHEIGVSTRTVRSWEQGGGIQWKNAKAAGRFYEVDPEGLVHRELQAGGVDQDQLDRIEDGIKALSVEVAALQRELAAAVLAGAVAPEGDAVQAPSVSRPGSEARGRST